ncbi:phage tail protein [Sphingomonas endolithica]|uniref:phage tail protein n=1 Tax=Sphingomonas endolithica TaxID=2972485 RepID=UPI0021AE9D9F|nr:phage tail protein [Sphingomonas sp. ZFBP2030]
MTLAHYDPARDYQSGLQRAQRPGAGRRELRIEMPAALSADAAKTMAKALVARGEAAREKRTVTLGWSHLHVMPGDVVTIRGIPGVFRVADWWFEAMVVKLECVRLSATTAAASATSGRVLAAPDAVAGQRVLHVFEMPPLDDTLSSSPRMFVAAAGTGAGWRQAALLYRISGEERWTPVGRTASAATLGTLASPLRAGATSVSDQMNDLVVDLAHENMVLAGAGLAALVAGANVAMVGDELLQFGKVEQVGRVRWRLSNLLRGRRGTEGAMGRQAIGDRFVLVERDTLLLPIDLPLSAVGGTIRDIASGIGDLAGPAQIDAAVQGISVLPPSPVHLISRVLPNGDALVSWVRRSRSGWRWVDGVDAPLGEEREGYRATIMPGRGPARTVDVAVSEIVIPAVDYLPSACVISVRQVGSNGESAAATIELPMVQEII